MGCGVGGGGGWNVGSDVGCDRVFCVSRRAARLQPRLLLETLPQLREEDEALLEVVTQEHLQIAERQSDDVRGAPAVGREQRNLPEVAAVT